MNVSRTKRSIGNPTNFAISVRLDRQWINPVAAGGLVRSFAASTSFDTTPGTPALVRAKLVTAAFVAAAVAAAILVALPTAHAQDTPTAAQSSSTPAPSAPSSSSGSTATPPAAGDTATGPAAAAPAGQSAGTKADPVCFKLTGHCVDSSKTSGKAGTATAKTGSAGKKPLNLTAPDVRTVVPEEDLKEPLPNTDQVTEVQESQTVSVKGEQGVPPDVPVGLCAIWWAVSHPSQAWRILTPAE
jgi:hypothetical protein